MFRITPGLAELRHCTNNDTEPWTAYRSLMATVLCREVVVGAAAGQLMADAVTGGG